MKKFLVTGSGGMLAEMVKKVFREQELFLTDEMDLDVRNYEGVMRYMENLSSAPDYVLHLAAETNLEACQASPQEAYLTNTIGTINMLKFAQLFDIPIIYISTAGVFRGDRGKPYSETDTPQPINHYGRSKYYGEIALNSYDKIYIFRMSWAMGGGPKLDKKFVNKIVKKLRTGVRTLYALDDVVGSPTYSKDVVMTIYNCLQEEIPYGLYHTAGRGGCSRFEVAKTIVEILGVPAEVIPVKTGFFKNAYPCPRAKNEQLTTVMHYPDGVNVMRGWREALDDYLRSYYAHLFKH